LFGPSTPLIVSFLLVRARGPLSRTFSFIRLFFVPFEQLHILLSSTILDFRWFLVDELVFIGDANSSSSLMVFVF